MENLIEKAERMMATILEVIQEEPENSESTSSVVDDDLVADSNLNGGDHHRVVELCW
jgi:hypothetical protein